MDKKHTQNLLKPIKITTSISLLLILNPFAVDDIGVSTQKEVRANTILFDAQHGCYNPSGNNSSDDASEKSSGKSKGKSSSSNIPNPEVLKEIYEYLHGEYGFSAEFIAGVSANWIKEAQLDPTANEPMRSGVETAREATDGELGIGLGQWSFERHHMLVKHAKSLDKDWWETKAQLDYMVNADGNYGDILKDLALNSGDDPIEEAVKFHDQWERSADSEATVKADRGDVAKEVLAYMKENGMDGGKDKSKIEKIKSGTASSGKVTSNSSASKSGEKVVESACGGEEDDTKRGSGKIGDSTEVNGKSGKVVTQNYEYKDLPEKYKKEIDVPKFDPSYLDKAGNTYVGTGNKGQCTELTWAYMSQLWKKRQTTGDVGGSTDGNGNVIWKAYKNHGAKITKKPTVGYGFSSNPPQANAGDSSVGHTGVVVGVMDDGKWIMANYNVPPKPAPSRTLYYTVVDGTDGSIKFFSGVK